MSEIRLATYGTLAPGRVNHHQLEELDGHWSTGTIKGQLIEEGWGAALGYPGLILDPAGEDVEVFVFESNDLPDHWQRLDEFEGSGYQRSVVKVQTKAGVVDASIYLIAG